MMSKQTIVAVSREFGSGGHIIAEKIAEDLGFRYYDRSMLDKLAEQHNMDIAHIEKYDEKPKNRFLTKTRGEYSNSLAENLAQMQFQFLRDKADSGESFVVVGRCAETVLKDREGLISIFVVADKDEKIRYVMNRLNLSEEKAASKVKRHDLTRKIYHNDHSNFKWGDSRYYDVCINSSRLGFDRTAEVLEEYIKARMN